MSGKMKHRGHAYRSRPVAAIVFFCLSLILLGAANASDGQRAADALADTRAGKHSSAEDQALAIRAHGAPASLLAVLPATGELDEQGFEYRVSEGPAFGDGPTRQLVVKSKSWVDIESDMVAFWPFDDPSTPANDVSIEGEDHDGTLQGDAAWTAEGYVGGALELAGTGRMRIPASQDINLAEHPQRTISLWFRGDDVQNDQRKQVLFEEGGFDRGLNLYIYDGNLYIGGWNRPESGWMGTWLSAPVDNDSWTHAALVLSGTDDYEPGALVAYVNGQSIGSAGGSKLWPHINKLGFGRVFDQSRFEDQGAARNGHHFDGRIDQARIFNRALSPAEIAALHAAGGPGTVSGVVMTRYHLHIGPVAGAIVTIGGKSAKSSKSGHYELDLPAGTYAATCTHPDYVPLSATVRVVGGQNTILDWVWNIGDI